MYLWEGFTLEDPFSMVTYIFGSPPPHTSSQGVSDKYLPSLVCLQFCLQMSLHAPLYLLRLAHHPGSFPQLPPLYHHFHISGFNHNFGQARWYFSDTNFQVVNLYRYLVGWVVDAVVKQDRVKCKVVVCMEGTFCLSKVFKNRPQKSYYRFDWYLQQ